MLQFLTKRSDKYTIAEEAQMAIEGGCKWIQLTDSLDDGLTLKEVAELVQPLCEENKAFMVVDSDVALCNEMRIHGVHLHKGDMAPAQAREELGPHAVIGVDVETADDIVALKGLDIDYAVLHPFGKLTVDDYARIIAEARAKGADIPVVARGDISANDLEPLLAAGVNGFALSDTILNTDDPVATTRSLLEAIGAPTE